MGSINSSCIRYGGGESQLKERVAEVCSYCPLNVFSLTGDLNVSPSLVPKVRLGIRKMSEIVRKLHLYTMDEEDRKNILLAGLFFVYFSWANVTITFNRRGKQSRTNYIHSKVVLKSLLNILVPYSKTEVLLVTSGFFDVFHVWTSLMYIRDISQLLFICNVSNEDMFMMTCDKIEKYVTIDVNVSKRLLQITYDILQHRNLFFLKNVEYLAFVVRLRDMFHSSMSSEIQNYLLLRRGINVCLRQVCHQLIYNDMLIFISRLIDTVYVAKLTKDDILQFATVLEYAANLHTTNKFSDLETEDVFKNTLELMCSQNSFLSLLGCRLLQYLLDRHGNKKRLVAPMVFFAYSELGVRVAMLDIADEEFIDKHKISIQDSIMCVISNHSLKTANIGQLFACVALILLEVPCGLTAAWSCWVGVKVQDFALKTPHLSKASRHGLHALAISVISVACWVHNSDILYKHIGDIAARRATQAPHLNPPLRRAYTYAQYHVTWDKPDLFMDEWELRYGLWKTFNVLNTKRVSNTCLLHITKG